MIKISNKPDEIGYFGVGVYHPKYEVNFGSIWRTAMLFNSSYIFTVGATFVPNQPTDTINVRAYIPYFNYTSVEDMIEHMPFGSSLVGVELEREAKALPKFNHPIRAAYLFGAEDKGLPEEAIKLCDSTIFVPTARPWSMNLANCAAITMYDRSTKADQRKRVLP